jgi:hypothetical protein
MVQVIGADVSAFKSLNLLDIEDFLGWDIESSLGLYPVT